MLKILVVGGDSKIGRNFITDQRKKGQSVTWTTRRASEREGEYLALEDVSNNEFPNIDKYDVVILLAAISTQQACWENKDYAWLVNVKGPVEIARKALGYGKRVVFASTNLVVGGETPFLPPGAPLAPVGAYAQMKAEAEAQLLRLPNADQFLSIIRFTKVFDNGNTTLTGWRDLASKGQQVVAFGDLAVSPLSMKYVSGFIDRVVQLGVSGIFHCAGSAELSYAEFARAYLAELGFDPNLVISVNGREVNCIAAQSPPHSSLSYGKEFERLGLNPLKIRDLLADLKDNQ